VASDCHLPFKGHSDSPHSQLASKRSNSPVETDSSTSLGSKDRSMSTKSLAKECEKMKSVAAREHKQFYHPHHDLDEVSWMSLQDSFSAMDLRLGVVYLWGMCSDSPPILLIF
jgi:hypothetical protein